MTNHVLTKMNFGRKNMGVIKSVSQKILMMFVCGAVAIFCSGCPWSTSDDPVVNAENSERMLRNPVNLMGDRIDARNKAIRAYSAAADSQKLAGNTELARYFYQRLIDVSNYKIIGAENAVIKAPESGLIDIARKELEKPVSSESSSSQSQAKTMAKGESGEAYFVNGNFEQAFTAFDNAAKYLERSLKEEHANLPFSKDRRMGWGNEAIYNFYYAAESQKKLGNMTVARNYYQRVIDISEYKIDGKVAMILSDPDFVRRSQIELKKMAPSENSSPPTAVRKETVSDY